MSSILKPCHHAGSEYDEYFADKAEDEIVQVIDEQFEQSTIRTYHSAQQSARQIVLKKSHWKHNFSYLVKQKILFTQEAESVGNIKAKARKYKISSKQLRNRRAQSFELRQKARSDFLSIVYKIKRIK
jgi:hypothetical protein